VIADLSGDWLARKGLPNIGPLRMELASESATSLEFGTANLNRWDSGLMVFILKCWDLCRECGREFRGGNLPPGAARLLRLAQAVPERKDAARAPARTPWLQRMGESALEFQSGALSMVTFLGENMLACLKLARGRAQFRWADALLVMEECGPQALGIVALINFLVGLILAFVGATQLGHFGASLYVADLVSIGTVREMGCLMTAIIMCGRTGAAFAAQLGTMKVNQELEAFRTFGISSIEFLVLPRVLALIAMMPLLCIFADLIAISGGFLVSTLLLDVNSSLYLHRAVAAIQLNSFLLGIFKGGYFGVVIALTGCLRGMQCGSNAAAVGQATTSAVVTGITVIIASDGIFAVLCNALHI